MEEMYDGRTYILQDAWNFSVNASAASSLWALVKVTALSQFPAIFALFCLCLA